MQVDAQATPDRAGIQKTLALSLSKSLRGREMPTARKPILVDLALQGGGSHGAFTWGVLDRMLEEPWLEIDGISGTSAGAMNAAVMVHGHQKGGAAGGRGGRPTHPWPGP